MPKKEYYHLHKEKIKKEAMEWYSKNLGKAKETRRRYYLNHRETVMSRSHISFRKLLEIWTNGIVNHRFKKEYFDTAEQFALEDLQKYGFTNISRFSGRFSFDLVGELNGQKTLVDVTTGIVKNVKLKANIARLIGLPFYLLFVRPDLSFSYLMKYNGKINMRLPTKVIHNLEKTTY